MSEIKTTTANVSNQAPPKGASPTIKDLGVIGKLVVSVHSEERGEETADWSPWNYAIGRIEGAKVYLESRTDPWTSGATEYDIIGRGNRSVQFRFEPGPAFDAESMKIKVTVKVEINLISTSTIGGNTEESNIAAGAATSASFRLLSGPDETTYQTELSANGGTVTISRELELGVTAAGKASQKTSVSGNVSADPTTPPEATLEAESEREVSGSAEGKIKSSMQAVREGAEDTIDSINLFVEDAVTEILEFPNLTTRSFVVSSNCSALSKSSASGVVGKAVISLDETWIIDAAVIEAATEEEEGESPEAGEETIELEVDKLLKEVGKVVGGALEKKLKTFETAIHQLKEEVGASFAEEEKVVHRGRIQIQGDDMDPEISWPWMSETPPTAGEAIAQLNRLYRSLSRRQKRERNREAIRGAFDYILNAEDQGGVDARVSVSFQNTNRSVRNARIDIEVETGRAFTG